MSQGIVKLAEDEYVSWSTVCDAPATFIHSRAAAVNAWGEDRVARADEHGHSWRDIPPMPPIKIVACNRAGDGETELTLEEIRAEYRRGRVEG